MVSPIGKNSNHGTIDDPQALPLVGIKTGSKVRLVGFRTSSKAPSESPPVGETSKPSLPGRVWVELKKCDLNCTQLKFV